MKKALFFLFSLVFLVNQSFAQKHGQQKIDSLFTVLKTLKPDTAKVNTLDRLAYEFENNNPDTAIYFADEARVLAIKLNYKMGIANACYTIGTSLSHLGNYEKALKTLNDALKIYDQLLLITTGPENTGDNPKILKKKANVYNEIGLIYLYQGNYPEALKNFTAALKIHEETGNKNGIASLYNNIGLIFREQGNYPEALKNFFTALKIFKETGAKQGIANNYNNIGIIYEAQGNFSEALKNFLASLEIKKEIGDKHGIGSSSGNIGNIYRDQGNIPEALKYYLASLKIAEEIGDKYAIGTCYNNLGNIYASQKNYPEALKYHFASLKIGEEIGDKEGIAFSYLNVGDIYITQKKNGEASQFLNKGLSLAKEIGSLEVVKSSYRFLAELDSIEGNYLKSLEHYKMYIITRDSIFNQENTKKTVQSKMQYEFDNKEAIAKAEQEKKDAIALKEMQKQKLLRNALIGGFAFLLILGVIIFVIMIQYREIRAIKKERNRISGELHDDIGADLNRITMVSQLLQKRPNKDKEMQEQLGIISEAGKMVLGNIGEIIWTMNPQQDNLEGLVAHIRRFVTEYLEMNRIEVGFDIPDDIPERSVSDKYRRNIFLAIKEAIYNITKYSKATRVQLSMNLEKRMAGIEIHDNGTGFSVINKQNWGNGLRNMNQRMKDIGGNFQISSGKDQGTLINLNFPVH
jgi:signal transduction histidine kinase